MCSIIGVGERLHKVLGRLDLNSGFHGNRKPPLTYNGENDVSTFSRLFFIRSFLYLQVTRTCIKSRTSSNFRQIGPLTTELVALKRLKISHKSSISGLWFPWPMYMFFEMRFDLGTLDSGERSLPFGLLVF